MEFSSETPAFDEPIRLTPVLAVLAIAATIFGQRRDTIDAVAREQTDLATVSGAEISASNPSIGQRASAPAGNLASRTRGP